MTKLCVMERWVSIFGLLCGCLFLSSGCVTLRDQADFIKMRNETYEGLPSNYRQERDRMRKKQDEIFQYYYEKERVK